ncbi:MAG: alpha-mannosidase [Armatimonadota bacterium]|nr:MAG: alpha-mannosidase [Armatimonadota bacterium]
MSERTPVIHLVCNAHIDPIWMWHWEEGAREAISTFRTAADFLDEYPEFVFNHNESVLYEWVEEYDPALFARIRQLVEVGRWNISGGWYLQPDCNMPGGETFVRLIAAGRRYFADRFGVRPKVAYNFDSFGHNGSLPQLLRQSGYEMYLHCRPPGVLIDLPAPQYRWRGLDGSEILALRPAAGWYGTPEGHAIHSIRRAVELARETGEDVLVLWGLGDHGGGATRKDLDTIRVLMAQHTEVEIRHSTPEAYLARLKPASAYPLRKGDLQRSFAGCYTSMAPVKRAMRRGEALLTSAERWSAIAWRERGREYPHAELETAWKGVLFNTFHDILAGSSAEAAYQDVMEIFGRSADICRRLRLSAQLALLPSVAPQPGTIPVYVFNPHGSAMTAPVSLDFLMAYMPPREREPFALYDDAGRKVPSQDTGGTYERTAGTWHRNATFVADVPALSVRRYEIRRSEEPAASASPMTVRETKAAITVENRWMRARFLRSTGGLASLVDKRSGRNLLRGSVRPVATKDTLDAWGGEENATFNEPLGDFAPLTAKEVARWAGEERGDVPALHVLSRGPVSVTVQSLVGWRRSRVCQQFTFYADLPYVDVNLRVHWQERRECLKWVLPLRLRECRAVCEVPFAAIERPSDGTESVGGRWVRLAEKGADRLAVGIANDGQYGFHARSNGELGLSLLRGAVHCRFGDGAARANEHHTYIDQGQHDFRFRLLWGKAAATAKALIPAAMELNLPLEPSFMYHQPTPGTDPCESVAPRLEVTPPTVVVAALKKAEQADELILRLSETLGRRTRAAIKMSGAKRPTSLEFRPFQVKTLRVAWADGHPRITACNLLEEG